MGNVLSFEKYKEEFYAEFDEYYSTYPIDVEKEIGKLDKEKRDENPCTEKRKVYELARKCKVHSVSALVPGDADRVCVL